MYPSEPLPEGYRITRNGLHGTLILWGGGKVHHPETGTPRGYRQVARFKPDVPAEVVKRIAHLDRDALTYIKPVDRLVARLKLAELFLEYRSLRREQFGAESA